MATTPRRSSLPLLTLVALVLFTVVPAQDLVAQRDTGSPGWIRGRLVDARTGEPLPNSPPTQAFVQLDRCLGPSCRERVALAFPDATGRFVFDQDYAGHPLPAGEYSLSASAQGYQGLTSPPMSFAAGQELDLGEVALLPMPFISSLRGRLVDAVDGSPLAGDEPPFAAVSLDRCDGRQCVPLVAAVPDADGWIFIDAAAAFLEAGTYRLTAAADQYDAAISNEVVVAPWEDFDFGDLALVPWRIQVGDVHYCDPRPGEDCRFAIDVRHRGTERFFGAAWGIVDVMDMADPQMSSTFQIGRFGALLPIAQPVHLRPGETKTLEFRFPLPEAPAPSALFCVRTYLGQGLEAPLHPVNRRFLYCLAPDETGRLSVVPENEALQVVGELSRF